MRHAGNKVVLEDLQITQIQGRYTYVKDNKHSYLLGRRPELVPLAIANAASGTAQDSTWNSSFPFHV